MQALSLIFGEVPPLICERHHHKWPWQARLIRYLIYGHCATLEHRPDDIECS